MGIKISKGRQRTHSFGLDELTRLRSRGLGASIAEKFAAQGCNVAINFNASKDRAEKLADKLAKEGAVKIVILQAVGQLTSQISMHLLTSEGCRRPSGLLQAGEPDCPEIGRVGHHHIECCMLYGL